MFCCQKGFPETPETPPLYVLVWCALFMYRRYNNIIMEAETSMLSEKINVCIGLSYIYLQEVSIEQHSTGMSESSSSCWFRKASTGTVEAQNP